MRLILVAAMVVAIAGCGAPSRVDPLPPQGLSLLGTPLYPEVSNKTRRAQTRLLDRARKDLEKNPGDELAWVWVGRRLAYLGRYQDSITHYTAALERFPDSVRLRRHRGHRYITVRELDLAHEDLSAARRLMGDRWREPEPDGLPNAAGIPRTTTASNVWYHLALTEHLRGNFARAQRYWGASVEASENDDALVSSLYWFTLASWRIGDGATAGRALSRVRPEMDIIENHDYHRLLLLYKGELQEDDVLFASAGNVSWATVGYGVAMHRRHAGDEPGCRELLGTVLESRTWAAFGFIAAEAEVARLRGSG